jgi:hypothetical protein
VRRTINYAGARNWLAGTAGLLFFYEAAVLLVLTMFESEGMPIEVSAILALAMLLTFGEIAAVAALAQIASALFESVFPPAGRQTDPTRGPGR